MSTTGRRIAMTPRNVVRVGALVSLTLAGSSALGGTAYAFWLASGAGTGAAQAGVVQPLTTTAVVAGGALLYPGGPPADVTLRINNPNPFPVTVTDVTGTGAITSSVGAACDASTGVTFTDRTGLTLAVAAGASQTFTLAGAVSMDNSSDNTCQGASFTIPVALVGGSG